MTGPIRAIVFDFDATLGIAHLDKDAARRQMFDRLEGEGRVQREFAFFANAMAEGQAELDRERMATRREPTFAGYYGTAFANAGVDTDEALLAEWRDLLLRHHEFRLYPSTARTIQALRQRGISLAVVSNTINGTTTYTLQRLGLLSSFVTVIQSCDVGVRKPDPKVFLMALDVLGVPPEETASVGNSPYFDIAEPGRLGMTTVLMRTELSYREPADDVGSIRADFEIDRTSEVLDILDHGRRSQ